MAEITVVTPVFNGEQTILKSIRSLQNQTFKNWCCIIVNDGSTDNTKSILDNLNDERFNIVHFDKNMGRPIARQRALELVTTKYMCMLDSDDWYYPEKLQVQFDYMEENDDVTLMSNALGVTNINGELIRVLAPFHQRINLTYSVPLKYFQVPHASSIIRVSDIKQINYNSKLKLGQDQDFMRRLLLGKKYVFCPRVLYIYNRENSFTLLKYIKSSFYTKKSVSELNVNFLFKNLFYLKCNLKMIIVAIFFLLGKGKLYLNQIGSRPSDSEKEMFNMQKVRMQPLKL